MKYYETTKVNQILEVSILSHNNFKEIFEEFDSFKNKDIINTIKIKNKNNTINNVFLSNNNINNNEVFISFGKNEINDQAFSPIPIQSLILKRIN